MKHQESFGVESKKGSKFAPYTLTQEQRDTNPNGLWESFLDGTITTIKNCVDQGVDEDTVRNKIAKAMEEDLSKDRQKLITVDEVLLIGLRNFENEHGGSWVKNTEKWKGIYEALQGKSMQKEKLVLSAEKAGVVAEIERELIQQDWDSVSGFIEENLKKVPSLDPSEYDALRDELWKKFNAIQSAPTE